MNKEILEEINKVDIPAILSDLVSFASFDSEQGVVGYLANRFDELDVEYKTTDVAPKRQNLIAQIGSGPKSLILNAHTDTVPPGNLDDWEHPPLKLTKRGNDLVGLGSCDDKGSLVSMLTAFEILARHQEQLKGRLILQAVCCEETRGRGTEAEVKRGLAADAAIVGEPTDLVPMIGHKGGLGLEITVHGKAAHGSSPEEGINAISKMAGLIQELDVLAEKLSRRLHPLFGHASLAVTQISAGRAPNVIPPECTIRIDRRLIPGESLEDAVREVADVIELQKKADPELNASLRQVIGIAPCMISSDEPIVEAVVDGIMDSRGIKQQVSGFTACCDMWHLVEGAHIPTVILGPGRTSMAHKANESVDRTSLYEAAKIYAAIAMRWLG